MFCSNCGSPLAEGAKFCSECGTKVERTEVRDFGTLNIEEPAQAEALTGSAFKPEEALESRVSFDWSNVIDEPQKKEIPQGIKSPWAATGSIDERQIYSEMKPSEDKNRTMSFIDVLKADKEEREKAALDKSIEYTEVLEIDPEVLGGTKPPKLRMAPLYEDVDEPVKTPFDDMDTASAAEDNSDYSEPEGIEAASTVSVEDNYLGKEEKASRFEIPDFLKKAVGFGAGKDVVIDEEVAANEAAAEEVIKEAVTEEAVADELIKEAIVEEAVADELIKEAIVEETVADESALEELQVEEHPAEAEQEDSAENAYLDEDLYLELSEEPRSDRISRIVAHADEYESEEDEEEAADDYEAVDEKELFSEMSEPGQKKTGMTIAAPADEEAEIEALKKRLAELTGTVEIDPALLEEAETEAATEPVVEPVEEAAAEGSFEALGTDFTFEPEVTEADNRMFEDLMSAREVTAEETVAEVMNEAVAAEEEPSFEDFTFEPEVTDADSKMFEGLIPASELAAETAALESIGEDATEPSFGLSLDDELIANEVEEAADASAVEAAFGLAPETEQLAEAATEAAAEEAVAEAVLEEAAAESVVEEAVTEAAVEEAATEAEPSVEDLLAKYVPQYFGDNSQETAGAEIAHEAAEVPETAVNDTAHTEFEDFSKVLTEESAFDAYRAEPETISLDEPVAEVTEPAKPLETTPAVEEPKATDAVSLEDLEKDIFGAPSNEGADAETTKKIDKFYTLYRKNEEFQRLLDEEYSKLKGENIVVQDDPAPADGLAASSHGIPEAETEREVVSAPVESATKEPVKEQTSLEELAGESRPVEDATIYRVDMPEDLAKIADKANDNSGFSVGGTEVKSFGLDGADAKDAVAASENAVSTGVAGVAAAGAAGAAGAAALTKAEKKAAKKAEKKKKKEEAAAAQVEYEEVDAGSTVLTVLAVVVAILLVALLVVILILHVAPNSGLAMAIDQFIENITSRFSDLNTFGGQKLL